MHWDFLHVAAEAQFASISKTKSIHVAPAANLAIRTTTISTGTTVTTLTGKDPTGESSS